MLRVMRLCALTILTASCGATSAGPIPGGEPHVPCSSLAGVRHSPAAIDAMTFDEARATLANARVIRRICGK